MTKYIGLSGDPAIHEMSGEGGIGEMLTQDPETAGVFWTDFVAADMRALWDALISRALMSQSSRSDQWKNWEASLDALVASARLDLEKTSLLHPEDLQQWIGELMDRVEPVDPMRLYPEAASLFTSLLSMFVEVADSLHGYVSVATECIADALKALRSDEYAAVVGSYRHREDVLAREEKTSQPKQNSL